MLPHSVSTPPSSSTSCANREGGVAVFSLKEKLSQLTYYWLNNQQICLHGCAASKKVNAQSSIGLLITGAPGVGKSRFLNTLLASGYTLVADDYVHIAIAPHGAIANPANNIEGLLALRGDNTIQTHAYARNAVLTHHLHLATTTKEIQRARQTLQTLGMSLSNYQMQI